MNRFLVIISLVFSLLLPTSCISSLATKKDTREQQESSLILDNQTILELLFASIQTYTSYAEEPLLPVPGYGDPREFGGTILGNQEKLGLIYKSEEKNSIIVAFRGSKSWQDWVNDFRFTSTGLYRENYVDEAGLLVETGFYTAYETARDEIIGILDDMNIENSTTLYITGHSLGGASAVLFALDYVYNGYHPAQMVYLNTFAAPRVGNETFVSVFNDWIPNSLRVVNQPDAVPELPLKDTLGYMYQHTLSQYSILFYPEEYALTIRDPAFIPLNPNSIGIRFNTLRTIKSHAACHEAENYYTALTRIFRITGDPRIKETNALIVATPLLEYIPIPAQ